jgi:hypothetical protein
MTKNWSTKSTHYEDGNIIHSKCHLNFINFLFTHMKPVFSIAVDVTVKDVTYMYSFSLMNKKQMKMVKEAE